MYICYMDESGVPLPGAGTSHFIMAGVVVPARRWKQYDADLTAVKNRHGLADVEIHTAWMARFYPEQERVGGFAGLSPSDRRDAVTRERAVDLARASMRGPKAAQELRKNYQHTSPYIALTRDQRIAVLRDVADVVGGWDKCVLFADAQDKSATRGRGPAADLGQKIADYAFEQVVTRFHTFLARAHPRELGLLVCDQNQAVSTHLTDRVRRFHRTGTLWSTIPQIVETPMFVDSRLTSMVQVADLVSYAIRRFIEKGEADLLDRLYTRFDRANGKLVGLRHYTGSTACTCRFCQDHQR